VYTASVTALNDTNQVEATTVVTVVVTERELTPLAIRTAMALQTGTAEAAIVMAVTPTSIPPGSDDDDDVDGLLLTASNNTIRGLVINRFTDNGLEFFGSNNNRIECNFSGTNVTGTAALSNGDDGVLIFNGSNNTIGGTTAGARNLFSGNNDHGIGIRGSASTGNIYGASSALTSGSATNDE
jgi:hypothetical protein